jgi:hypothetical protein
MVSISQQSSPWSYSTVSGKKRDITSLGQMCPPAATSVLFGELGPVVPSGAWWVVGACGLPSTMVGRACLVIVNSTACLNRGRGLVCGEGAWHGWQSWWLRDEGSFCCFGGLVGKGVEAAVMASVVVGEVRVVNGAVIPKVGMPLR